MQQRKWTKKARGHYEYVDTSDPTLPPFVTVKKYHGPGWDSGFGFGERECEDYDGGPAWEVYFGKTTSDLDFAEAHREEETLRDGKEIAELWYQHYLATGRPE